MADSNYIPFELLLAGYENLSLLGKLRWKYYKMKHKISAFFERRQVMTNKHIIDGIDVSKCEGAREFCYDVNIICIAQYAKCEKSYCKDNKDCLYKQLERIKQECEVWKKS